MYPFISEPNGIEWLVKRVDQRQRLRVTLLVADEKAPEVRAEKKYRLREKQRRMDAESKGKKLKKKKKLLLRHTRGKVSPEREMKIH